MKHRPDIVTFSMERYPDESWEEYDDRLIAQAWIKAEINSRKHAFRDKAAEIALTLLLFGIFPAVLIMLGWWGALACFLVIFAIIALLCA